MVTFEFAPFVLGPARRVLLRAGDPQALTPRAFDLLLLLVQQRDRVLSDRTGWAEAWVANRDGSGLQQVTRMRATELGIGGRSPDGRRIVIDAAIAGNSDVYLVDLDGRPPFRLTSDPPSTAFLTGRRTAYGSTLRRTSLDGPSCGRFQSMADQPRN